jgi:phage protein D
VTETTLAEMVDAPTFFLRVKPVGEDAVRLDLGSRLLSLEYEDHERKADRLRVTVDNWDLAHFDDPIFKKGNIIEVQWGYAGNMSPPRSVKITKISGFQQLQIEALDKGTVMNTQARPDQVYENKTHAEIARAIAERNGYGTGAQFIQDNGITYPSRTQGRLTDAQFMRKLAHIDGYEFYIDFDGFHFHERVVEQDPVRRFVWYNAEQNREGVLSIEVKNDVYAKPGRVKSKAIDPDSKEEVTGTGSNEDTKRKGTGELAEFYIAVDQITDNLEFAQKNAGDWERPMAVQGETGAAATKNDADKRYRKASQVAVKMTMTVIGDPALIAKTVVRVEGVGKRLTGNYYIKAAKHSVSSSGYTTQLEMISDGTKGYVRVSDVLFEEKAKADKQPNEDPESGADANDKEPKEDEYVLAMREFGELEDTLGFFDAKGRQNLPSGS